MQLGSSCRTIISTLHWFTQSEYRAGHQKQGCFEWRTLVAIRLPQLDVASFRLHLPSLLNVATSITCQALLSRGSCLVMDLSCSRSMRRTKLGLIKDMARSRVLIENKPGFCLRMMKDAKTGLMLINVACFFLQGNTGTGAIGGSH